MHAFAARRGLQRRLQATCACCVGTHLVLLQWLLQPAQALHRRQHKRQCLAAAGACVNRYILVPTKQGDGGLLRGGASSSISRGVPGGVGQPGASTPQVSQPLPPLTCTGVGDWKPCCSTTASTSGPSPKPAQPPGIGLGARRCTSSGGVARPVAAALAPRRRSGSGGRAGTPRVCRGTNYLSQSAANRLKLLAGLVTPACAPARNALSPRGAQFSLAATHAHCRK